MANILDAAFPKGNGGFRLLTPGNPKTVKGEKRGFLTFILHLAPGSLSGFNVCPKATDGCLAACLNLAGRGGMMAGVSRLTLDMVQEGKRNTIQNARIRKTKAFFADREAFMSVLVADIAKAIKLAEKQDLTPVFRLNGTSDIRWETIRTASTSGLTVFETFPGVQFYDYTKIANRKNIPGNYALTFSLADGNDASADTAIRSGMNVAAVFRDKETVSRYEAAGMRFDWTEKTWPVANGDESDLRFLDPKGHVIALYAKGNAKADTSGFVRD